MRVAITDVHVELVVVSACYYVTSVVAPSAIVQRAVVFLRQIYDAAFWIKTRIFHYQPMYFCSKWNDWIFI